MEWRRRRSELTHDWLRNRLLPRLRASIAIARGEVAASPAAIENIVDAIREWPLRRGVALLVATDYATEMSPSRAASRICESLPADIAEYIRSTACDAWSFRHDVPRRLARVSHACNSADVIYETWDRASLSLAYLQDFAVACDELAAALSDLPEDAIL